VTGASRPPKLIYDATNTTKANLPGGVIAS